jgi:excisionase family DNA binding protein
MTTANTSELEELMTVQDVARICRVQVGTVRRWRFDGHGPRGILLGRHLRFRPEDVRAWLDSRN